MVNSCIIAKYIRKTSKSICLSYIGKYYEVNDVIGASLSEPHTSDTNGMSDRLRTITIKYGKFIYSSIDNSKLHKE